MTQKLFVRYAGKNDTQAVFDFYAANPHEFVVARDAEVWRERIASGAVTIIEDAQGNILAAAISYPLTDKDAQGNDYHRWTEIGSVRVALPGAGLFDALLSAHVMRAFLLEPPDDRFVVEIMKANRHSKYVFGRAGGAPLDIPDALREKVEATIAPGDKGNPMDWYQLGPEAMPGIARMLLHVHDNPVIRNRKDGREYEFDFSRCAVTQKFMAEIKAIAGADYGDAKKPDLAKTIRSHRDKLKP